VIHRVINSTNATIYTWHITEPVAELARILEPYQAMALESVPESLKPRLWHNSHFLSTRILLFKYAGLNSPVLKNSSGKPFNEHLHVSISHSHDYAAVIVSENAPVAIDLEKKDPRILRVAHKFIHEVEKFFPETEAVLYTTHIWSAKETLYKLYSANEVIFKEELRVHPFTAGDLGNFRGDITKPPALLDVDLQYFSFDNYVLTWCSIPGKGIQ
jgi:4'-phosphopantetheinyl transferase